MDDRAPTTDAVVALLDLSEVDVRALPSVQKSLGNAIELGRLVERLVTLRRGNRRWRSFNLAVVPVGIAMGVVVVSQQSVPLYWRLVDAVAIVALGYIGLFMLRWRIASDDDLGPLGASAPLLDRLNDAAARRKDLVDATGKVIVPLLVALIGLAYLILK